MYNSEQPQPEMLLSPLGKRREQQFMEDDIALETSQLLIRSNNNKKPRYESSWTLDNLCTHPCSPLASIDLESIFNMSTFQLLSQEKRDELVQLLPEVDQPSQLSYPPTVNTTNTYNYSSDQQHTNNFFSKTENPIFWNTLSDWQSMLSQGEYHQTQDSPLQLSPSPPTTTNNSSSSHKSVPSYHNRSKSTNTNKSNSSSKDKFKDEAFESYWGELIDKERPHNVAGDSKNITLKDMCRKGLIREGDIIVYKRNFSACKVVVSKSMTVVKASGLSGISIKLDNEIFEDFETPTALETKILDHHGKVTKDKRPNGNAFKSIRLIRLGQDLGRLFDIRKDGFGDTSSYY